MRSMQMAEENARDEEKSIVMRYMQKKNDHIMCSMQILKKTARDEGKSIAMRSLQQKCSTAYERKAQKI